MVPPLCNTSEHLNFRAGLLYRGGASDGTPLLGLLSSRMASRKVRRLGGCDQTFLAHD